MVPLIDAAALASAESASDPAVVALDAACMESGFFRLSSAAVPCSLVEGALDAACGFFARPLEEKLRHCGSAATGWRGYTPMGGGHNCSPASRQPERKESFYWGEPDTDGDAAAPPAAEVAALDAAARVFHASMLEATRAVLRGLSLAMGMAPSALEERVFTAPSAKVLLVAYDPVERSELSCGSHTDCGFLTMLCSRGGRGLQVRRRADGTWLDVDSAAAGGGAAASPTFVCNLGDLAARLSGGRYASTPHRVLNDSAERRVALVFFNNLDESAPCDVAVQEPGGGGGAAAAVREAGSKRRLTCGQYVAERLAEMRGGFAERANGESEEFAGEGAGAPR
mmetsp:Transcript_24474/g.79687  ORF Transcript_24474/g.79687 Transcript_24474/m.79687 type:complete len:340 (+) Transcript_24474:136-1155(+)